MNSGSGGNFCPPPAGGASESAVRSECVATPLAPISLRPILPLTSIRFFAAFWVVMFHTFPLEQAGVGARTLMGNLIHLGFTAVGLFFVLSGFILTTVYASLPSHAEILRFWVARFARIYPVYLISLLVDWPRLLVWRVAKFGFAAGFAASLATLGGQALLAQSWLPVLNALNPPSWSISTEVFFYLLFPLLLPPVSAIRSTCALVALLVLAWFATLLVPVLALLSVGSLTTSLQSILGYLPPLRVPEFMAGMLLARLIRNYASASTSVGRRRMSAICLCFALFGLMASCLVADRIPFLLWQNGLMLPLDCCVIAWLATCRGRLLAVFSFPACVLLGEASYSLYLLHAPLWHLGTLTGIDRNLEYWLSYIVVLIMASLLFFAYVERPARRRIVAFYDVRVAARRMRATQPRKRPEGT